MGVEVAVRLENQLLELQRFCHRGIIRKRRFEWDVLTASNHGVIHVRKGRWCVAGHENREGIITIHTIQ